MNKTAYIICVRISSLLRHTIMCSRIKGLHFHKNLYSLDINICSCEFQAGISFLHYDFCHPSNCFIHISNTVPTVKSGLFQNNFYFILLVSLYFYNYICDSSFKTWLFSCMWVYKTIWWEFLLCTGINVGSLFHFVCASQYFTACESSGMPQLNRILKQLIIICNYCKWHRLWW